jgi:hypothetical protein
MDKPPGVLAEIFHIRVRRGIVEVEVVLLHILSRVSLAVCQSEKALF